MADGTSSTGNSVSQTAPAVAVTSVRGVKTSAAFTANHSIRKRIMRGMVPRGASFMIKRGMNTFDRLTH